MTKAELIETLKDIPDDAVIDIYDLERFDHPVWRVNTETYFDYDKGIPIVTIETNYED